MALPRCRTARRFNCVSNVANLVLAVVVGVDYDRRAKGAVARSINGVESELEAVALARGLVGNSHIAIAISTLVEFDALAVGDSGAVLAVCGKCRACEGEESEEELDLHVATWC
jgi:hypothetical protein